MEIPLPQTNADLLPFAAAVLTILVGLFAMFMPRVMLKAFGIRGVHPQPQAVAEMRASFGGFYIGLGLLSLLLFDQPVIQMILGGAWAFSAFGRLVAILSDGVSRWKNTMILFVSLLVSAAPLSVAFGFVQP